MLRLDSDIVCELLDVVIVLLELDELLWLLREVVDKLLSLSDEVLADDKLLLDKVLEESVLAVDWLDSVIVWELLDVVIVWLLEGEDVLLLVVMVWLDELLDPVEIVERLDWLDSDWLDLLLAEILLDDRLDVLTELVELLESVLVDRLDWLLLLVETLLVLLVETLDVLDVLRLDRLLLESELLLSVLVEELETLETLDSLNSSTSTIRRSWAIGEPCWLPLYTIPLIASLVGKSRMAGGRSTLPPVSVKIARQSNSLSIVTETSSSVAASACVVR